MPQWSSPERHPPGEPVNGRAWGEYSVRRASRQRRKDRVELSGYQLRCSPRRHGGAVRFGEQGLVRLTFVRKKTTTVGRSWINDELFHTAITERAEECRKNWRSARSIYIYCVYITTANLRDMSTDLQFPVIEISDKKRTPYFPTVL
ncbi:hypothetical protein R1flu_024740 [Riccia fluitans]|uniref:Uncharacterized protein n=1 Tax=Riccia fluitans TaxID=41844 RepID=A0ABD1XZW4_9MARC